MEPTPRRTGLPEEIPMDMGTTIVALAGIIATFGMPLAAIYLWKYRPNTKNQLPARVDPQLEARLERIETAVQAIAVETERISEGQRFTTKLLSESRSIGAPDQHARVISNITPGSPKQAV